MSAEDNDIELLAGQVWLAPIDPLPLLSPEARAWVLDQGQNVPTIGESNVTLREALAKFLKPQAEIVRRAPLPEESENDHLPPHYSDLVPPKGK